jgi:hypothetical protein
MTANGFIDAPLRVARNTIYAIRDEKPLEKTLTAVTIPRGPRLSVIGGDVVAACGKIPANRLRPDWPMLTREIYSSLTPGCNN